MFEIKASARSLWRLLLPPTGGCQEEFSIPCISFFAGIFSGVKCAGRLLDAFSRNVVGMVVGSWKYGNVGTTERKRPAPA